MTKVVLTQTLHEPYYGLHWASVFAYNIRCCAVITFINGKDKTGARNNKSVRNVGQFV